MSNNTKWLAAACVGLLALAVLTAIQSFVTKATWWTCVVSIVLTLAVWKFAARRHLESVWNTNMKDDQIPTAKPFAFLWLATKLLGVAGFMVLVVAVGFYQYRIPSGILVTLTAAWFITTEIWAICLVHATATTRKQSLPQ